MAPTPAAPLPGLELHRPNNYLSAVANHYMSNGEECFAASAEERHLLLGPSPSQSTKGLPPVVVIDADLLLLRPGETAVVPAVWDRRVPNQGFLLEPWTEPQRPPRRLTTPGLCPSGVSELMVYVTNLPPKDCTLEQGLPVGTPVLEDVNHGVGENAGPSPVPSEES